MLTTEEHYLDEALERADDSFLNTAGDHEECEQDEKKGKFDFLDEPLRPKSMSVYCFQKSLTRKVLGVSPPGAATSRSKTKKMKAMQRTKTRESLIGGVLRVSRHHRLDQNLYWR